jgi:hypothetical protein
MFLVSQSNANKKSAWGDFFHACWSAIRSQPGVGVAEQSVCDNNRWRNYHLMEKLCPRKAKIWIDQAGRKKRYFTLGRRMNILITRSFDPLAEQLDENIGYRRHKLEMNCQSINLRGCVVAKLRPSRDP